MCETGMTGMTALQESHCTITMIYCCVVVLDLPCCMKLLKSVAASFNDTRILRLHSHIVLLRGEGVMEVTWSPRHCIVQEETVAEVRNKQCSEWEEREGGGG